MVKPPSKLFIDSAALIALFNKNDQYHGIAFEYYNSLTKTTRLFTTLLVVSETYTWLRYRLSHGQAIEFLDVIKDSVASGWLKALYPDAAIDIKAQGILRRFKDQDLSYVDAISFATMEDVKIKDVFTFDTHFYMLKKNIWPLGF